MNQTPSFPSIQANPLLTLYDVSLKRAGAARPLIDKLSLSLKRGETAMLVGESGCGKEALIRLLAGQVERGETVSGQVRFNDGDWPLNGRKPLCLQGAVYLPGPHAAPLSPHVSALSQLAHVLSRRLGTPRGSARAELALALGRLDGAPPIEALDALPGQILPETLAFGLFALTFTQAPALILADQPLGGIAPLPLRVLADALKREQNRLGFALLYAAMGTEIASRFGERTLVLRHGRVVEEGPHQRLSGANAHAYTRTLFRDWSKDETAQHSPGRGEPVLRVFGLPMPGARDPLKPSDLLNFELRRGGALAFIGASGSGRHALMRQIAARDRPRAGRVLFDAVDTGILAEPMLMRLRRRIAYVAGDDDALDPRMTIADTVSEPLRAHLRLPRDIVAGYREAALKRVGLASLPGTLAVAELSRFDKRRLQVARAIVSAPLLAILDEPLAGLDAFAQSVMRDLLSTFRVEEGPAVLLVTADFSVARTLVDTAFVFDQGRVVERGLLPDMLRAPKEPTTKKLIAAAGAARGPDGGGLS